MRSPCPAPTTSIPAQNSRGWDDALRGLIAVEPHPWAPSAGAATTGPDTAGEALRDDVVDD